MPVPNSNILPTLVSLFSSCYDQTTLGSMSLTTVHLCFICFIIYRLCLGVIATIRYPCIMY